MRRLFAVVLALLCLASPAVGGSPLGTSGGTPSVAGPGNILGNPSWWKRGLTFWAPFNDPDVPLALYKGTGSLTFTRAHDATHTATFVHPTTGLVTVAAADQLRIEANGALIEGARTNIALYSDNLANAAWVKVNMDAAMNQIGPDGVGNSASLLTATSDGGTILQTVLSASAAHSYAVWLKRVSGTGAVSITIDGTTWTEKTITSSWSRASKENVTVLNPIVGIKLSASGDNIAVALNQLEVAPFSSSSISTVAVAVSRNRDQLSAAATGNMPESNFTVVFDFIRHKGDAAVSNIVDAPFTVSNYNTESSLAIGNGYRTDTNSFQANFGSTWSVLGEYPGGIDDGINYKIATALGSDNASFTQTLNGGAILSLTASPAKILPWANDVIYLGSWSQRPSTGQWIHLKNVRIWNRAFSDAEMQAITTP